MRKYIALILLSILTLCNIFAQSVQSGIVLEYNGKNEKKPLANVEIVVNNASSTVSDSKGAFTLKFRTLKPGDKITIRRIEKIGYEVLNQENLSALFISRKNEPFTIVMCKSETIKKIRNQYNQVAHRAVAKDLENEERVLKYKKNSGEINQEQYEKELNQLKIQYEEKLENIENYIERFSRIDLSVVNSLEKEILDLLKEGKVDQAIEKYESHNLIDSYKSESNDFHALSEAEAKLAKATSDRKESIDSIKNAINRQIGLLWLVGGKDNYQKALNMLYDVAKADTTDINALIAYADMAFMMKDTQNAMNYYDKSMNAVKDDIPMAATVLIKRGSAYLLKNQYDLAMYETMTALHNLDSIVQATKDPDIYLPERCYAQLIIAGTFSTLNDKTEALRYYDYAKDGYKVLSQRQSEIYSSNYAGALLQYGKTLGEMNNLNDAESYMVQATEIYNNLYQTAKDYYSGTLAYSLCLLGDFYRKQRRYEEAEMQLQRSTELYKDACRINPDGYIGFAAECYQTLGKLHIWTNDYQKASNELFEAYEIYLQLAEKNPDMYNKYVANISYNIGSLYYYQRDYKKCAEFNSLAVERYKELYNQYSKAYYKELGVSFFYLGNSYFQMKEYAKALDAYENALKYDQYDEYIESRDRALEYVKRGNQK